MARKKNNKKQKLEPLSGTNHHNNHTGDYDDHGDTSSNELELNTEHFDGSLNVDTSDHTPTATPTTTTTPSHNNNNKYSEHANLIDHTTGYGDDNDHGDDNDANSHNGQDEDDDDNGNVQSWILYMYHLLRSTLLFLRSKERVKRSLGSLFHMYKQFIKYTFNDIRSKKVTFFIGLSSCFIVVWMVIMCVTALDQVPLIFMRLAEMNAGEFDLRVYASQYAPGVSLSYKSVMESIKGPHTTAEDHTTYSYFAPRLVMGQVTGSSAKGCADRLGYDPSSLSIHEADQWDWMYVGTKNIKECGTPPADRDLNDLERIDFNNGQFCVPELCQVRAYQSILVIYDHDIEKKIQLGRKWTHAKLGAGEVYMTASMAKELNVKSGDSVILTIPLMNQFIGPFREAGMIIDDPNIYSGRVEFSDGNIHIPVTVKKVIDSTQYYGKISTTTNSAIFIEYSTLMPHLAKFLPPQLFDQSTEDVLSKVDLYKYAEYMYINHPPSRLDVYNENDYAVIQRKLVTFASKGLYLMGFDQLQAQFPVLTYMKNTQFFALFLGLIISIIVTILTTLSVILIYSLLMINVENRTFEMGVLRMIGIRVTGVVQLILVQAFFYAVPGWIFGVILGQVSFIGVAVLLSNVLQVEISRMVTWRALGLATALGIIIPIVSSILPIWTALGKNLTESLDASRSKTKAVKYSIDRASEGGINWTSVIVGSFMVVFGASVYYFFPLSLLSLNLSLLLYMFFGLLLAMLLGLIMLSLNFESSLEFFTTQAFFFWENYAVRDIVLKNLVAHRLRNRKTTIMFSLSLGFIIFLTLSFTGQIKTLRYGLLRTYGTRVNMVASSHNSFRSSLTKGTLEKLCTDSRACKGYTYISYPLNEVAPYSIPQLTTKGGWMSYSQSVYAVSANFFDVTGDTFVVVDDQPKPSSKFEKYGRTLTTMLYEIQGSSTALVGSLYKSLMNINLDSTFVLELPRKTNRLPRYEHRLLKPLAFLDAGPVGTFSKFPLLTWQSSFVSFPTFVRMSNNSINSVSAVPIQKMLLDINEKASGTDVNNFLASLRTISREKGISFKDLNSELEPLSIATQVLDFFFIFTTVVAMSICFFSLMSSMYSNINEQAKEIGILRAIGCRKGVIIRLFIYEAFVLIIAASIMGILIGLSIGYTMALQNTLFTQLPVDFIIPWKIILVVFGLAIVFSFISSIGPIVALLQLPIVTILRRLMG